MTNQQFFFQHTPKEARSRLGLRGNPGNISASSTRAGRRREPLNRRRVFKAPLGPGVVSVKRARRPAGWPEPAFKKGKKSPAKRFPCFLAIRHANPLYLICHGAVAGDAVTESRAALYVTHGLRHSSYRCTVHSGRRFSSELIFRKVPAAPAKFRRHRGTNAAPNDPLPAGQSC